MRISGRRNRGRLQARMARHIAFAVVVSLMVGTFGVVFYRYHSTREALESSARRFAALVSVPLAQVADMYGDQGLRDPLMTRVSPLLQLNEDVEKLGIYRKSGQLVFFATPEEIRIWPQGQTSPPIEDLDALPPYAWDLLERYWPRAHRIGSRLQIYLSRGCPYRCTFCMERAKGDYRWRGFGAERALEELSHDR